MRTRWPRPSVPLDGRLGLDLVGAARSLEPRANEGEPEVDSSGPRDSCGRSSATGRVLSGGGLDGDPDSGRERGDVVDDDRERGNRPQGVDEIEPVAAHDGHKLPSRRSTERRCPR